MAHGRQRSSSDPFQDQVNVASHVSYVDNIQPFRSTHMQDTGSVSKIASIKKQRNINTSEARDPRMLDVTVRDAVTVRTINHSPRSKMIRSHTA